MNADTSTLAATDETTGPVEPMPTGRSACVIGSGFGGLALAIRLQSAGIQTTVVESEADPCVKITTKTFSNGHTSSRFDAGDDPFEENEDGTGGC